MTLFNRNWIGFAGDPLTGKTPTQTLVHADQGVVLTGQQQGAVAHAYKLFCDAITVSSFPGGYHVQNRTFVDGTRVRMTSISGIHQVHVWPPGVGENPTGVFRGFVVSPNFVTGETVVPALDKTILTATNAAGNWTKLVAPYVPGIKRQALEYAVSATQWASASTRKSKYKTFELFAGRAPRGVLALSDDKYNDVFARDGRDFYKNGAKVFSMPVNLTAGYPALFMPTETTFKVVVVDTHLVQGITTSPSPPYPSTAVVGYDWNADSVFIVGGEEFRPAPEIKRTGWGSMVEYRANFMVFNITLPGAVQTKIATLKLQPDAPFYTMELLESNQLGVQGVLNAFDGWNSSVVDTSAGPTLMPIQNPRTLVVGQLYTYTSNPSGNVDPVGELTWSSADIKRRPGGSLTTKEFDRTYSIPETVKVNATDVIAITRSVHVVSHYEHSNAQFGLHTPVAMGPSTGLTRFGTDWAVSVPVGNFVELTGYEAMTLMTMTDNSLCKVEMPGTPKAVWDVTVTHTVGGGEGGSMEYPAKSYADSHAIKPPTGNYGAYIVFNGGGQGLWVYAGAGVSGDRDEVWTAPPGRVETDAFTARSTDYIYSDRANGVFVWIECEIVGSRTGNTTGSAVTTVRSCVRFNGVDYKTVLLTRTHATRRVLYTVAPWGIDFGTSALAWGYHQPRRPHPIYAPRWQGQETCPFIAHTVAGELAAPRIAAHFRLQMERRYRGPFEPELPFLKNTTGFSPYMMQQMLENYGHAGGTDAITETQAVFDILEATPVVIKLTSPDAALFTNLGAPDDDAKEYANFYRT